MIAVIRQRAREVAFVAVVALAAFSIDWSVSTVNASRRLSAGSIPENAVDRGRQVYISEGCIHCHSQYVRPNSPDVLMWGPAEPLQKIRLEQPPLIGNRRQGPDLSQVGARRSAVWLKAHLFAPAEVSGASIMPSYAFLFHDERGDELVAYLASLQSADLSYRAIQEAWRPSDSAWTQANIREGQQLYHVYCATCHDPAGDTQKAWQLSFHHPPGDLMKGPYRTLRGTENREQRLLQIAHVVKFGITGTDMPGHEYLPDQQVSSISLWLSQKIGQSNPLP
jgi:cytochrome c oxidase cbb3-type subunit 2